MGKNDKAPMTKTDDEGFTLEKIKSALGRERENVSEKRILLMWMLL